MVLTTKSLTIVSALALSAALAAPAFAADLPTMKAPPAPAIEPIQPLGFFVRLGVIYAINTSTSNIYFTPAPGAPVTQMPGAGAKIGNVGTVGVEVGYFVTQNISLDVSGGLPQWAHDDITNVPATVTVGTRGALTSGTTLAKVMPSAIPVTLNYHFMGWGAFQPYVGAGFAPVFSFNTRDHFATGVTVNPTVGAVLVAGADVMIDRHWGVTFNVKKIFASVTSPNASNIVGAAIGAQLPGKQVTNFQPWVLSTGVTYRF